MFGSSNRGASSYAKVGLETSVVAASPHKLIVMLFDGALVAVLSGLMHMRSGNIPEKGKAISKAIQIIDNGLRASLDKKAGGQIAENLDSLYEYMSARLLAANLKNDTDIMVEIQGLLTELRETWNAIGAAPTAIPADVAPVRISNLVSA
ncbi:flagellar export chaperone FliS [Massilia antarctica]|uniref:Flagellar secretion chaperone FliS n=1 Tax=Massilia antarctica TaxID=2765360 RepID=A0AA48WF85_9BURK|nr:flagellar export chaperone FliS [Massilia antarctica]QPI50185.1 flagellar export chaperone FliS [Massilia antarctica]